MSDLLCPIIKDTCIKHQCAWYSHLIGNSPQTGAPIDEFGCAVTWLPILLIENSKEQRDCTKSIDMFRNEMVKANDSTLRVISAAKIVALSHDS